MNIHHRVVISAIAASFVPLLEGSFHVPVEFNSRGIPTVNATALIRRNERLEFTALPFTLNFNDRIDGGIRVAVSPPMLRTRDNGTFAIRDPSIVIGPDSLIHASLPISKNSRTINGLGSVAYTGDDLILQSTSAEFLETCHPESYSSVVLDALFSPDVDRINGTVRTADGRVNETGSVGIQLRTSFREDELIGSVPFRIWSNIVDSLGATVDENLGMRLYPFTERFVRNCTQDSLQHLPNIVYNLNATAEIILYPTDYIRLIPERTECVVKLDFTDLIAEDTDVFLNPLMVPGLNFRLSNDLLEICESNDVL